jgi:hypothetical protein
VIADDVWAKVLWAGLNLQAQNLPAGSAGEPIVGQVIEAWQAERPTQPKRLDRKTIDHVDLSSPSVRNLAKRYISRTLIPTLCAMVGAHRRCLGNVTSHRARPSPAKGARAAQTVPAASCAEPTPTEARLTKQTSA